MLQNVVLVAFVVTVIVTDWRWRRIPNVVTYPTIAIGLVLGLVEGMGHVFVGGFWDKLAGLVVAFAVAYPFYALGGLKAGDAKLLMAVGALRGVNFLLYASFFGALAGGVIAICFVLARRLAPATPGDTSRSFRTLMRAWIPYGIALGSGALIALALELRGA